MSNKKEEDLTGTKEWKVITKNCDIGCNTNCLYCYARLQAHRFNRIDYGDWQNWTPNIKMDGKKFLKSKFDIMFPSSHNIYPKNKDRCFKFLDKLVKAKNRVLIVLKPHISVIKELVERYFEYRDNLVIRFSITSQDNGLIKLWELNGTDFEERLECLQIVMESDFNTSVSAEPFLDHDPIPMLRKVSKYINYDIWLGCMNYTTRILNLIKKYITPDIEEYKEITKNYEFQHLVELKAKISKIPSINNWIQYKHSYRKRLQG